MLAPPPPPLYPPPLDSSNWTGRFKLLDAACDMYSTKPVVDSDDEEDDICRNAMVDDDGNGDLVAGR